ncbi:MAG: NAD-dependent epimerase/dehydratase family protein [Acetobacteraceae bacterium]|nr:NAD-dependent epimerase/dehydratase family protein [Acetobacteraceae bacterium]
METYVITGGAGFIGSHLADALLRAGHRVRILDNFSTGHLDNLDARCEVIRGDVCDQPSVRRAMIGVSGCFHLAAIASVVRGNEDWIGTHQVNLGGFISVMDASRQLGGIPVVYASSAAVYGKLDGPAAETGPIAPLTAYGADKLGCELHARIGTLVHNVPALGFRFFNVYGPRQDPASPYSGVISIFAKAISEGLEIEVHGSGQQTRDFVFVGDIVQFLQAGMSSLRDKRDDPEWAGLVLNACTGRETSVLSMAQTLGEILSCAPSIRFGPARRGDIERSVGVPHRATDLLGISAETGLHEGLVETLSSLHGAKSLQRA